MAGAQSARGGGPRGSRRGAHGGDVGRVRAASSAGPRLALCAGGGFASAKLSRLSRATAVLLGFFVTPASARERCRRAASARPPARRRRSWMGASGTGRRSESSNPNRASGAHRPPARSSSNRAGARKSGSPRPPPSSSPRASQVDPRGGEEQEQRVQMDARDRGAARRGRGVRTERTGEAVRGCPHRRGHRGITSPKPAT